MSPEYVLFLTLMNIERHEADMADREAMDKSADDFVFGDAPIEPSPLTPEEETMLANEPEYSEAGEEWYLQMLIGLRVTAGEDVSPAKLEAIDLAIEYERKS
jgi:hypothetical protein